MKFYERYYESGYDELIAYYPRFYKDVFEMVEILKAFGRVSFCLEDNIERVFQNQFILTADADTIAVYEAMLKITPNPGMSLEERRKMVLATLYSTPHIGEPEIRELFHIFCDGDLALDLNAGVVELKGDISEGQHLNAPGFLEALSRPIPAHLSFVIVFETQIGVVIATQGKGYGYRVTPTGLPVAGTLPQRSTVSALRDAPIIIEAGSRRFNYASPQAGTIPQRDTTAGVGHSGVEIATVAQNWGHTSPMAGVNNAGTHPGRAAQGGTAAAEVDVDTMAKAYPYASQAAGRSPYAEQGASAHRGTFRAVAEGTAYRYTVSPCGLSYCNKHSIRR